MLRINRGRGNCGKDTRNFPSLNRNTNLMNEPRFFSGILSSITNSTSEFNY
jgi:hypothetical protein